MFHAGKHGVGKHESWGDRMERSQPILAGDWYRCHHGMSRVNGEPNIGQMKPSSTLICEHFISVALQRSPASFLSSSQFKGASWDRGVARAKIVVYTLPHLPKKSYSVAVNLSWEGSPAL